MASHTRSILCKDKPTQIPFLPASASDSQSAVLLNTPRTRLAGQLELHLLDLGPLHKCRRHMFLFDRGFLYSFPSSDVCRARAFGTCNAMVKSTKILRLRDDKRAQKSGARSEKSRTLNVSGLNFYVRCYG